ncbi:hypothetical protein GCM10023148_21440 [Actinokineospora soli]
MRTLLAWLLGLAGAAAVGYGVFQPWRGGVAATGLPFTDLFSGDGGSRADLIASIAVPLLVGAAVAVVGVVVSAGALRAGAAIVVITAGVWTLRHGGFDGLQLGYWNAAFGTLLLLVAAGVKP